MAGKAVLSVAKTWAKTPLATVIDLYIVSKQIDGRSAKTLGWYRDNLERFAEFTSNGSEATLREVSLDNACAFIGHLQGRTTRYDDHESRPVKEGGLSPHSVHAYVRTLKAFSGLSQAIRRFGAAAGVDRLHAHLFRHTFAVRYLMNGPICSSRTSAARWTQLRKPAWTFCTANPIA